ncbi:MAG: hypothetical protein AB1584_09940 [Pseudomonadota bacterium]
MGTLDSRIALALMAKAELVFGQAGVVLSFPIAGSSYTASQLNFFPETPTAEDARVALTGLVDFSTFANAIPDGRVWQTLGDRPTLPQVYRRVLEQSEVAALPEDPQDLEQLRAARALLFTNGPDGTPVDTPAYAAYKTCRDAYILVSQNYNSAKASGELGGDEARQAWEAAEPELRAARDRASQAWLVEGHRAEIDDALAKIALLNQKTPTTAWDEWKMRSEKGIGTVTDLAQMPFWPTYISPANACENGWQLMKLTRGEVLTLQGNAPEQLKARIGSAGNAIEVDELEFEYTSAKLHRPWFDSAVFSSRFWRPRAQAPITLSSGAEPYTGECPLYASGVVFFRRIRATVKAEAEAVNQTLGSMGDKLDMGILSFQRQRLQVTPAVAAVRADTPLASMHLARPAAAGMIQAGALAGALRQPLAGTVQAERFQTDAPAVVEDPKRRFAMSGIINKRLVLRRPDLLPQPAPPPAPPPQPGNSVLETAPDDIFILALICSVVPQSPNPDPALKWPQ